MILWFSSTLDLVPVGFRWYCDGMFVYSSCVQVKEAFLLGVCDTLGAVVVQDY